MKKLLKFLAMGGDVEWQECVYPPRNRPSFRCGSMPSKGGMDCKVCPWHQETVEGFCQEASIESLAGINSEELEEIFYSLFLIGETKYG